MTAQVDALAYERIVLLFVAAVFLVGAVLFVALTAFGPGRSSAGVTAPRQSSAPRPDAPRSAP